MDTEQLAAWLAAYKYSWEAQDADAFVKLFTADCQYADRPYAEPVQGKDFHAFWTALAQRQRDNLIEFEVLEALPVNRGMAVWKAQYVIPSTGEQKEVERRLLAALFQRRSVFEPPGMAALARDRVPNNTVANSDFGGTKMEHQSYPWALYAIRHSARPVPEPHRLDSARNIHAEARASNRTDLLHIILSARTAAPVLLSLKRRLPIPAA